MATSPTRAGGLLAIKRPDGGPIAALLFDMDGVLTQTATIHSAAWKQMFDEYLAARQGPDYQPFTDDDYLTYVDGRQRADGAAAFFASRGITLPLGEPTDLPTVETINGLANRKAALAINIIETDGVATYPDAITLLRTAREAGLATACVTASRNAPILLDAAGIAKEFDAVVDGNYAGQHRLAGKPAPDMFLAAAELVGVAPESAAVLEDATAGVAAGRAGGFGLVIGVDRHSEPQRLTAAGADIASGDLTEFLTGTKGA